MKVELDLSTEQLEQLDKGLTDMLLGLTEEQKVSVIQAYLNDKFDKFYEEKRTNSYYGSSYTKELSEFGKTLIENLQEKISDATTSKILEDERLQETIKESIDFVESHLTDILQQAIIKYVASNLFTHKYDLEQIIRDSMYDMRREMNN